VLRADSEIEAVIKVHLIKSFGQISTSEYSFTVNADSNYYSGEITIPSGFQCAFLEIGTNEVGALSIQEVFFINESSPDHHKINVGHVDSVGRIIEPVEIKKLTINEVVDVTATTVQQCTESENVFLLNTYTYSVLNLGAVTALIHMQCSPDDINFNDEPIGEEEIEPGQLRFLTPNYALPYVRLCYRTESGTTSLRVFLQGHD
jgi:hypothetical protein